MRDVKFVEMGLSRPKGIPFIETTDLEGDHMYGWGENAYRK